MTLLRTLLTIATITTLASPALAQGGFRIDVAPIPASPVGTAQSNWLFRLNQQQVHLRWQFHSFSSVESPQIKADTSFTAHVNGIIGAVAVSPQLSQGHTQISHGKQMATFDMNMAGSGRVNVWLDLQIDASNAAAGSHETIVELTVSGF